MNKSRKKRSPAPMTDSGGIKDFLDMIAPSVIDFKVDHFLCGNTYRCVWALREYPTSTDEQAILRHLGEMDGVTIRIYTRQVTASEEKRIIHNAANRNRMSRSSTEDLQQTVTAEANLQDVVTLVSTMHRNREPLLHCAVFLELTASSYDALKLLQTDVLTELVRSKLNVDRLLLRQREGFVSVMPSGWNHFGEQFERVLPASSVANLYPFNYSGKTDPHGFYIGKDKYGANILVDFDKRDDDKTSASILILGNSGQGKSYLLKLLLLNFLEAGKSVISLDVEHEQQDTLDEGDIHDAVISAMNELFQTQVARNAVKASISAVLAGEEQTLSLPAVELQIRNLQERQLELFQLIVSAGADCTDYDEELRQVNMAKTKLMAKKAELEKEQRGAAAFEERLAELDAELEQSCGALTDFDELTVRQLVSNIKVLDKDSLLICFKDGTEITQAMQRRQTA